MPHQLRITETAPRLLLWGAVAILVAIGVAAAVGRALVLAKVGLPSPELRQLLSATAVQELAEYDRAFKTHPVLTFLHIVPGGIFLMLAPFQFSSSLRTRHLQFHRWSGRVIVIAALLAGFSALFLGVLFRFTGPGASSAVILFGALFLFAVIRAFIAIRHRDLVRHREWMIRAFSIGIGISTIRIIASLLFAITRARPFELIGWSFWIGWILTFAMAELWIRHTRSGRIAMRSAQIRATPT